MPLLAGGAARAQGSGDARPFRDLAAANAELAEANDGLAEALERVDAALALFDERRTLRADVIEEELALATAIQAHEEKARRLAVEAYMTGRGLSDAAYLLDSVSANDWAFRTGVLSESVDAVAASSRSYVELRSEASAAAIDLADAIDEAARAIESAREDVSHLRRVVADAEYVVSIAEIHAKADAAQARFGRPEPSQQQWLALRRCESTEVYSVATGNGFWGAYQFTLATWLTVGGVGYPSEAPPEEQDARARLLYHRRGASPWPVCGRFLPQD